MEPAPQPSPELAPLAIAYRAPEFAFADNDDPPKLSRVDGELLAEEITDAWREHGLVRSAELAQPDQRWPGDFFYVLTFSGRQRNDSGFWSQGFNTLTLFLLPYSVTHHYDIACTLENVLTGQQYRATVQATDETWVTLPLVFALPFYQHGHRKEMAIAADRLYESFASQGAFAPAMTNR
ncbi:MAG TPA: hypothetical protein VMR50_18075 [Myxococcota bacterium]|nr:hypothetical protein [Myxococcota bacterium]